MGRRDSRLTRMNETRQEYFDRKDSNKKLAFERKVVRKLLKSVGVSAVELRANEPDADSPNADFYLSIGWLHNEFPEMPIRLMSHIVSKCGDKFLPKRRVSPWRAWKEVEESLGCERKDVLGIGCVYLDNHEGLQMVMHDSCFPHIDPSNFKEFGGAVKLRWESPDGKTVAFIQPLDTYLIELGNIWRPRS